MARLHLHPNTRSSPSMLSNIGQKIQHAAEFAGSLKGIYDLGKMAYNGFKAAAPAVAGVAAL